MGVEHLAFLLREEQGQSDVSIAALLQVGLEEQALDLAALVLLLGLDLVKGELEDGGGCQPGLEQRELQSRWCSVRRDRGCCCHMLTVVLP
jgi:hypothetical protein